MNNSSSEPRRPLSARVGWSDVASIPLRLRRKLVSGYWHLNEQVWKRLPPALKDSRLLRAYGRWSHNVISRRANRDMPLGTMFLRNRPALELMRRLADEKPPNSTLRIAVLGCSVGVEVYSIVWNLRRARPDLKIVVRALDISRDALSVAETGIYGPQTTEMVRASIFERLTSAEMTEMFDWDGDQASVKSWLRAGVTWEVGDACDPELVGTLGNQDLVVASNFLCHMDAHGAERCLRNLVHLVTPGGHLFVSGVDLDVRTKVAVDLGWEPIPELRSEIHDGDPSVRGDWPWYWWGLEPLDRQRPDWETRYSGVFRVGSKED
jgi:SAM-dependent methyltransferase